MKRIIVMVRTSTDKQSTEDQHNEMVEFVRSEGFAEDEIEWVEQQGASAFKVDDDYKEMIARVKQIIADDPSGIEALAVWHLNRAFRNIEEYASLSSFLIRNNVNLITKNPYLKLLKPNGEVDQGMELAAGLLAILAKQDNEERIAKFKRAKRANSSNGKYNGGVVKYGYMVDNGYVVPKKDDADTIRLIYELYATGKYSMASLARELSDRGIKRYGMQINSDTLIRILSDTAYIGYTDNDQARSHRTFVPIIDKDLWDAVAKVRKTNYMDIPRTGEVYIANKILKCPVCGGNLHMDGKHYLCNKHTKNSHAAVKGHRCQYTIHPPASPTHSILWSIASEYHVHHLIGLSKQDVTSYKEHLDVVLTKISTIEGKINDLEGKRTKIIDSYIDGLIDKPKRDLRLAKLSEEREALILQLHALCGDRNKTQELIDKLEDVDGVVNSVWNLMTGVLDERDKAKMAEICRTYIVSCTVDRVQFGKPDPRSKKPNALEYKVSTVDGYTYRYLYLPCSQQGNKYYAWNGKEYEPIMLDII